LTQASLSLAEKMVLVTDSTVEQANSLSWELQEPPPAFTSQALDEAQ